MGPSLLLSDSVQLRCPNKNHQLARGVGNELELSTWECVAASRKQDWDLIRAQPYSPLSSRLAPMPGAGPVSSCEKSQEDGKNY